MGKLDFIAVCFLTLVCGLVCTLVPLAYLPLAFGLLGLGVILVLWAHFGDLVSMILVWFVAVACFSYFFWKFTVPVPGIGGFNITIDRLVILTVALTATLAWAMGVLPIKRAPTVIKMFFLMLVFFTISLFLSGTKSVAEVTPHFRLAGGYYFPVMALVLTYFAVNDEPQIKKIAWFFFFFGLYLTLTAWAEHLELWSLVFPRYIADPEMGIHWGRSRGPFLVSASLGITLVFCFFSNLYLASRQSGPPRSIIYLMNLAMLPAIFFTRTRSVWLAMVICMVLWIALNRHLRSRGALMLLFSAVVILAGSIFYVDILSRDRTRGGVTDPYPVYARLGLVKITGQIVSDYPLLGVGFGHFRDYATKYDQDPTSKYIRFGSRLMEHNNFLSILAECGIVGLTLYLLVLYSIYRHSRRLYDRIPPDADGWVSRDLVVLFWILMVNYIIDGMFRETSVDPFNNGLFFVFTGLILAVDYLLDFRTEKPILPAIPARG